MHDRHAETGRFYGSENATITTSRTRIIEPDEFDEFVRVFTPMFKEGKKRAKTICLPIKHHMKEHAEHDIVCEDLKNVKHKASFYKSVNNMLQHWSYRQVIDKLESLSESEGFTLVKVDPTYTSQTCSKCGAVVKANREGEHYHCACGLEVDADTNAAINILRRGAYCPSSQEAEVS